MSVENWARVQKGWKQSQSEAEICRVKDPAGVVMLTIEGGVVHLLRLLPFLPPLTTHLDRKQPYNSTSKSNFFVYLIFIFENKYNVKIIFHHY